MGAGLQDNAMAEIALALAMAFFALMVLTLISMGSGASGRELALPAGAAVAASDAPHGNPSAAAPVRPEDLVVFYNDRFFDAALRPFDPAAVTANNGRRTVLALPPHLSLAEALEASRRLGRRDPVVTTLDADWMARLREFSR